MPRRRRSIGRLGCGILVALAAGPAAGQVDDGLSLERARQLAVDRSPALRQAEARASGGGAGRMDAFGRLLPSVRLSAGIDRTGVLQRTATDPITGGIIALPDSLIEEREAFGTSARLSLDWTLFDGGQSWLAIRAANAEADALDLLLVAARVRARAGATVAFLDALEAAAHAEVREAEASRARALLEAAEARHRTGAAPEIDVLQASLSLNEAELALEDARIEWQVDRLRPHVTRGERHVRVVQTASLLRSRASAACWCTSAAAATTCAGRSMAARPPTGSKSRPASSPALNSRKKPEALTEACSTAQTLSGSSRFIAVRLACWP